MSDSTTHSTLDSTRSAHTILVKQLERLLEGLLMAGHKAQELGAREGLRCALASALHKHGDVRRGEPMRTRVHLLAEIYAVGRAHESAHAYTCSQG